MDVSDPMQFVELKGHTTCTRTLAFSHDNQYLVSGSGGHNVMNFD